MISAKIDVTKIDNARLFKGEKGTYLDVILVETPNNQYGNDYMVVQSVTKEEREAGVKGNILGNAKIHGQKPAAPKAGSGYGAGGSATSAPKAALDDEDVAF